MSNYLQERVTLEMVLEAAHGYSDADSEDDTAYRAAKMAYWRLFRAAVEQRARRLAPRMAREMASKSRARKTAR